MSTSGANNSPHPSRFSSSFDIIDSLVEHFFNRSAFSSVEVITLAGFSAGAQFLNRYAWASSIGYSHDPTNVSPAINFILGDPSSYLYMSHHRPAASCRPLSSFADSNNLCDSFFVPGSSDNNNNSDVWSDGLHVHTDVNSMDENDGETSCSEYDSWKHGIATMPTSGYNYLSKFSSSSHISEVSKLTCRTKCCLVFVDGMLCYRLLMLSRV